MSDIELIIKIPEKVRVAITRMGLLRIPDEMIKLVDKAIQQGTPLPKGHGDLIDRKALIENGLHRGFCDWYDEIKMADTIIEADKTEVGEWIDDKCSICGKGIEDLIYSPEWYRNEEPKFCPFCGIKIQEVEG